MYRLISKILALPLNARLVAVALACACLVGEAVGAADCGAGPDFCKNTDAYRDALAKKKRELSREYPSHLVRLLDRASPCVASVERAPDGFSIMAVHSDDSLAILPWTSDQEEAVKKGLAGGLYKEFLVFNTRRAFACHGDEAYSRRSDYDRTLDVNLGQALRCVWSEDRVDCH